MSDVTRILSQIESGDPSAAELLPLVYDERRRLAAAKLLHEKPGQTLQATALVHDAYLRLVDQAAPHQWDNRRHFFAAAAEAMRRILIERARQKRSLKKGGELERVELAEIEPTVLPLACDDILGLDDALQKLEREHPRKAELVKLRFFAGLTTSQAAKTLGVSIATAENDWAYTRSWLRAAATDMRKSFDGLSALVASAMNKDVLSGHLFLFLNRRRDRLKLLWWDRDGLAIFHKQLQAGTFEIPPAGADDACLEMDTTQLALLLTGVSMATAQRRKRFSLVS